MKLECLSSQTIPEAVAGAGIGLLSEVEVHQKDGVRNTNFVLGGRISQLRRGVVGRVTGGATQVYRQVLNLSQIEEQISLQCHVVRYNGEGESGGPQVLQVYSYRLEVLKNFKQRRKGN